MAARKTHIKAGILAYAIVLFFLYIRSTFTFQFKRDTLWLIVGFLLTLFGAEFPDLDQIFKKAFSHRDWFTHSAIFPLMISLLSLGVTNPVSDDINIVLLPTIAMFNIGVASHLIMDYFPTWKNPGEDGKLDIADLRYATEWAFQGITGDELVQKLVGTYLIHFPFAFRGRQTLNKTATRIYVITNALILIVLAYFMVFIFNRA